MGINAVVWSAIALIVVALIAASSSKKKQAEEEKPVMTDEELEKAYAELDESDFEDDDIDPRPWSHVYHLKPSGVTFQNPDGTSRQEIIKSLHIGDGLTLIREPENQYDKNAVAVYAGPRMVGYIGKESAPGIARKMDAGIHHNAIVLKKIGGEGDQSSNIVMRVRVYE